MDGSQGILGISCKPALFVLVARRYGMASLLSCASYLGRFPTHSLILKTVLLDRAGVGSTSE